jgi:hypothetical protein
VNRFQTAPEKTEKRELLPVVKQQHGFIATLVLLAAQLKGEKTHAP